MYRILAAHHGGVRERRDQLTHPPYAKPELLAERPNELWSWDISKLKGPAKWTYFYLYVILDVFSRYVVGWTVQYRETAQLAKALIEQATEQQQITPKILTLHADRGGPMRSKPVAFLLADLGVTKTHSRPYTSSDNPYSESNFKTLKYRPEFPARFDSIEHARAHCRAFFDWYNHEHRHSGIGLMTPAAVHHGQAPQLHAARARVLDAAYAAEPRAVRPQAARPARATDRRVDQQATRRRRRSLNSNAKRLTGLDRLRATRRTTSGRHRDRQFRTDGAAKRSPVVICPTHAQHGSAAAAALGRSAQYGASAMATRRRHVRARGLRAFEHRVTCELAGLLGRLLDAPKHPRGEHPPGSIPNQPVNAPDGLRRAADAIVPPPGAARTAAVPVGGAAGLPRGSSGVVCAATSMLLAQSSTLG